MIRIKDNKEKIIIMVLLLITITSLGVAVYTLLSNKDKEVIAPDYAKPEIEENAEPFGNSEKQEKENPERGSGSVDIIYEKDINIDLSENKVYLVFGNPEKSNHDILIQLIVKDLLISESGMIQSGNRVKELELQNDVKNKLIPGQYEGEIRAYFYNPVSAEKAIIDVKIPILIIVNE